MCAFSAAVLQTLVFSASTLAQELKPIADDTLGAESSLVTPTSPQADRIDGGAIRGANLFHSFSQFNIGEGREAYFANPSGIENILSRVTGSDASRIFGKLGVLGNANLFLINPNGIIFGRNASLDVRGSFVASTASSLKFADGTEFSAKAAQSKPLLTVSVPIGLQYGTNPGKIQVQGDGQGIRTTSELIDTTSGLRVQPNQTLALVGGDVSLEGATLKTAGGHIELGSVGDNSLVSLTAINKGFSLGYDAVQNFGNIQLSQQTAVDASGAGGGDIQVVGRRVTLSNGSQIQTSTLGADKGGTMVVKASELVQVIGSSADGQFFSSVLALVYRGATGDGGNVTINAGELLIEDGAAVSASTRGSGKSGNLTVTADKVQLIGTFTDGQPSTWSASTLSAQVEQGAIGDAGDLTINTRELLVKDGAQVGTGTFGGGKGGNLTITADKVQLIGISGNGQIASGLFVQADRGATGNAGDLTIKTGELLVKDGAQVGTGTFGSGKGGNLTVTADKIQLIGRSANGQSSSKLSAQTNPGSTGDAGDLTINTRELLIEDGAEISASTFGGSKGGNLIVTADKVQLIGISGNGQIASGLFVQADRGASGAAGDLTINTRELLIQDDAVVSASTFGDGKGGNLTINTGELLIKDGAEVSASTFGSGKGGNLTVTADKVQLIGRSANGQSSSNLSAQANPGSTGDAGDLRINTGEMLVQNGAQVSVGTFGGGKGGNLTITADKMQVIGRSANGQFPSGLYTQAARGATGNAGDLRINAGELRILDGAWVSASTLGGGKGGNLTVTAKKVQAIGRSLLTVQAARGATGNAGDLRINAGELLVQSGSQVSASTLGAGKGGNLTVIADKVQLIGTSANGQLSSGLIAGTQGTGKAGDLTITTQQLLISDGALTTVSSRGEGVAGNFGITASSVRLDNGKITAQTLFGNGGNLKLDVADLLLLRRGSEISTTAGTAQQPGDGGNITINAPSGFIVAVPRENSDITANAFTGTGGRVDINAFGIYGIQPRQNPTSLSDITASSEFGLDGTIELNTPDIDPNSALINLPTVPVDTELAQGCNSPNYAQSSFIITGRGGLPPNPKDILTPDAVEVDWVTLNPNFDNRKSPSVSTPTKPTPEPIVEATGWVFNAKGQVVFTADAPTTPRNSWNKSAECRS
ncbi:MAG: filamentous hemagglutinin N-terminal domain-containing protein [Spirirestis rafaelensis WJT71-NPBG6]|nr:filamentous hemagglutinin N-terminal domain-containing protein [Spirirestis rafaelensis WJT71-NPBG6]